MPRLCTKHVEFYEKGSRCPLCVREKDAERGSRRERGIGPNHEAMARELKAHPTDFCCSSCGASGSPDNPLTVGHIVARTHCLAIGKNPDDLSNLKPECRKCNLSKGAR